MQYLTYFAFSLCLFNAITGFFFFLGGEKEMGATWGPKWYLPIGWLPMALFAAINWPF